MAQSSLAPMRSVPGSASPVVPVVLPASERPAHERYTLERVTTGPVFRAQYLLVVRGTDEGASSHAAPTQVIFTTGDLERAQRVEQRVRRALAALPVREFEAYIGMNRRVRTAADVLPLPS